MRLIKALLVTCISLASLTAQDNLWTLQKSVDYALKNNLQVRQLDNQVKLAELQLKSDRWSRYPTLNGSSSLGAQLGRTIDPVTNDFVQQNIAFNSFNIQAGVTIFQGNRINNTIKQSRLDAQAAKYDAQSTANDVALTVANNFLTVLLSREQLSNARAQLQLTEDQLRQTEAGIQAGSLPESQRFDLIAQRASNQRNVVDLENQVQVALVTLQLSLELDPSPDFQITAPQLEIDPATLNETYSFEEVFLSAETIQPVIRAADVRRESAAVAIDVAKSGFYPTISAFGSVSSNYSDAARRLNEDNVFEAPGDPIPILIDGQQINVQFIEEKGFVVEDVPYFDQIETNFGQSIGLNLNVPIYNQGRTNIAVQRAKVNSLNADLQYQQAVNQLQSDVTLALTDWQGARQAYAAAVTSLDASQQSYNATKRRFDLGGANNLELLTATNRLEQARIEQTRAKYQLIFNRQVLQFYLGQPLRLQ